MSRSGDEVMQSILKRPISRSGQVGECSSVKTEAPQDLEHVGQTVFFEEDKSRAPNFTTAELSALLDLINNDYHFAHGNWDKVVGAETAPVAAQQQFRERWMDITSQINAIGGYDREWREVKRKLTTWMSKVKKKAADIHAYNILSSGHLGGRAGAAPRLSALDERVLSLLNQNEYSRGISEVGLLDNCAVSCELAEEGQTLCESPVGCNTDNHLSDDMATSDESAWSQRKSKRNVWDSIQRVTSDTDVALYEINKSVKSLVEMGKKKLKLEERKLKVAEELVQVQKELNANILKLIQGKMNSG